MRSLRKNNTGMTLVEILLSTMMLSVVSLALYSVLNNGIRIWERVNEQVAEEDINIFFDRLALDIRNAVNLKNLFFDGDKQKFSLPTLVSSPRLNTRSAGMVSYVFDATSGKLYRQEQDYSHICLRQEGITRQVYDNAKFLQFEYYDYDKSKKEYVWQEEWSKEGLPLAVRVELEINNDGVRRFFAKTVDIPVAQ